VYLINFLYVCIYKYKDMIKVKIKLVNKHNRKFNTVKEFISEDKFNEWVDNKINTTVLRMSYSILREGSLTYDGYKNVYSKLNTIKSIKSNKYESVNENVVQKNSRLNQLALKGNNLINLNFTPSKQKRLVKWISSGVPITKKEIKMIKSMFAYSKLSVSQYNLIQDIEDRVNRRTKLVR